MTCRSCLRPAATIVLSALLLALAGCTTARMTAPERTATEQLLLSTAAADAIEQLDLGLAAGTRVWLETDYVAVYDRPFVIGALRDRLLRSGLRLVKDRDDAEVVVEARAGALSIDEDVLLVGLPSWAVPIPFAAAAFETPELALYKRDRREGIASLALTAYAAGSGGHAGSTGTVLGSARKTGHLALFVIAWTEQDILPGRRTLLP